MAGFMILIDYLVGSSCLADGIIAERLLRGKSGALTELGVKGTF
jgi:hypothetical protein